MLEEMFKCFSWENRWENPNLKKSTRKDVVECLRALRPYVDSENPLIRMGPKSDGGYLVPVNSLADIHTAVCIGVGSADAIGFDIDLAAYGKIVYQFDHIIQNYVPPRTAPHPMKYFPKGCYWRSSHNTYTLEEICNTLNLPKTGTLLKVDIEGDEIPALFVTEAETLSKFDVIVMEIHWLRLVEFKPLCDIFKAVLDKLNQFHAIVHLHSNNLKVPFICQGLYFPNVLEVTWVRRDSSHNLLPNPYNIVHSQDVLSDPSKVEQHFPNPWCI